MDVYKPWAAEELRLADYAQGRRYGGLAALSFAATSTTDTGNGTSFTSGLQQATALSSTLSVSTTDTFTELGNNPFAPKEQASTGAKVPSKGSVKPHESEVEWLRQVQTPNCCYVQSS